MISKSISVSERVNMLPDVFHMLLFTWLVPHADDFGRLFGSPAKIKALVVPMLDKTIKDVEAALKSLHQSQLINWYEINGDKYIQIVNFEQHQVGLHKRTKSKFPAPPDISGNFSEVPTEENRTEGNRTEEKGREGKGTEEKEPAAENPYQFYQVNFGILGPDVTKAINQWQEDFPNEVIVHAMRQAIQNNKIFWGYANSCLMNWFKRGVKTLDDVKALQLEFEREKAAKGGQTIAGSRQNAGGNQGKGGTSPFDGFKATRKPVEYSTEGADDML